MANILEARAIITAEDRVTPILNSIARRVERMNGAFSTMSKMSRETVSNINSIGRGDSFVRLERVQAKLATSIDKMARSVDALGRTPLVRRGDGDGPSSGRGHGGGGLSHLAGLGAGYEAYEVIEAAQKEAFARAHEEARMRLSGMTDAEISRSKVDAANLEAQMPAVGQTEILHEMRNARAVIGSTAEAAPLMGALTKLRVIAQAQRPGEDVSGDMDALVKGLEIKGATRDPKEMVRYLDGVAKGLSVFGDTLNASQYYQMMLYGRQATPMLSENFILGTAPTLAQELRGSSYGRAVSAVNRSIVDGRMTGDAARELQSKGLIGPNDLDAKGRLKEGRSVAGWQLAQTDPNQWVRQFLLPALQSHGITDVASISKEIGKIFSNQLAAQMISILATQQNKIDKDTALLHGAMGLDGADYAMRHDPELAFQAVSESLKSLEGTIGDGIAQKLAPIAADFAQWLARANAIITEQNERRKNNPNDETPIEKQSRRAFNQLAFGIDSDGGYADFTSEQKYEAAYAKRRALLLKWRDETIDDPKKLAEIKERRKHVAPGFEKSAAFQDDMDQFPMRYASDKQLRELDAAHAAYLAAKQTAQNATDRLTSVRRFASGRPQSDMTLSPYIGGDVTDMPIGSSLFPTSRSMSFGRLDPATGMPRMMPMAAPAAAPPMAASNLDALLNGKIEANVKPDQITAKLEGQVTGVIRIEAPPGFKVTSTASSAEHFKLDLGTSMPGASVGARNGVGR